MAHHSADIIALFDRKYRVLSEVSTEDLDHIAALLQRAIDATKRRSRVKKTEFQLLLEASFSLVADQLKKERYYKALLHEVKGRVGKLREKAAAELAKDETSA